MTRLGHVHLEPVMGTVVAIASDGPIPERALAEAIGELHRADRVFSTWAPDSPMSRLRSGRTALDALEAEGAALINEVLERGALARQLTGGAFDPWSMPGGVDPTGLVKGWAARRALRALTDGGVRVAMVNAGGDIAVTPAPDGRPWRIGIRHPFQPVAYAAVVEVDSAVATSGDYERPGQLVDPATGRTARPTASATVVGPELDLADALATGLAVGGRRVLERIATLSGYDAFLVTSDGAYLATPGMRFASTELAA